MISVRAELKKKVRTRHPYYMCGIYSYMYSRPRGLIYSYIETSEDYIRTRVLYDCTHICNGIQFLIIPHDVVLD